MIIARRFFTWVCPGYQARWALRVGRLGFGLFNRDARAQGWVAFYTCTGDWPLTEPTPYRGRYYMRIWKLGMCFMVRRELDVHVGCWPKGTWV